MQQKQPKTGSTIHNNKQRQLLS